VKERVQRHLTRAWAVDVERSEPAHVGHRQAGDGLVTQFQSRADGGGFRQQLQAFEALAGLATEPAAPRLLDLRLPKLLGSIVHRLLCNVALVSITYGIPPSSDGEHEGQEADCHEQTRYQRIAAAPAPGALLPTAAADMQWPVGQEEPQLV